MGAQGMTANRGSLSDTVYEALHELITTGAFAENSRLPSENDLALEYKVSRPVLRQALSRLRNEGLVESRQGSGSFVSRRATGTISFGPLKDIQDVRKCMDFRRGIECEAAAQAAMHGTESSFAELHRTLQNLKAAKVGMQEGLEEDFAFHLAIAQATGNRFFVITIEAMKPQVLFSINLIRSLSSMSAARHRADSVQEHVQIYEAIAARDPEKARNTMSVALQKGIERVFGASGTQ